MQISRFVIAFFVVFIVYALLYVASFAIAGPGLQEAMAPIARAADDPARVWAPVGHALETLVIVTLYWRFVQSRQIAVGLQFGALMGMLQSGTQIATMGGIASPVDYTLAFVPVHIAIAALAGMALARLHRPAKA